MTKAFKSFFIVWVLCIGAFNIISFIVPNFMNNERANQAVGFVSINIAFIIMLICAYIVFKENDLKKIFLNLSLLSICNIGLLVMLIFGIWSMIDSRMPRWVSLSISILIIIIMIINLVLTKSGATYIESVDKHYEEKISFINEAKKLSKELLTYAKDDNEKDIINSLIEEITYGKNSNSNTVELDKEIKNELVNLKNNKNIDERKMQDIVAKVRKRNI